MDWIFFFIILCLAILIVPYMTNQSLKDADLDFQDATDWNLIKFWSDRHSPGNHMTKTENQRSRHQTATPRAKKKASNQPVGRYGRVDHMLNQLSHDERTYLERKLGTGELRLGDDGELVTLDEYRQRKAGTG